MNFSLIVVTNRYAASFRCEDVKLIEIKRDRIIFGFSSISNCDAGLILFDEIDHIGFYQAKVYILRCVNKESFNEN